MSNPPSRELPVLHTVDGYSPYGLGVDSPIFFQQRKFPGDNHDYRSVDDPAYFPDSHKESPEFFYPSSKYSTEKSSLFNGLMVTIGIMITILIVGILAIILLP